MIVVLVLRPGLKIHGFIVIEHVILLHSYFYLSVYLFHCFDTKESPVYSVQKVLIIKFTIF